MSFTTSSRFSVLQLVGDNQSKKSKKPPENAENPGKKPKPKKAREKKGPPEVQKPKKPEPEKEQMPTKKQKQLERKLKKKEEHITEKQWSNWQARDAELVDEIFEKDLKEAILLSQIEQEGNRRKKAEAAPAGDEGAGKKGKKPKKISLQEFMAKSDGQEPAKTEGEEKSFSFGEIEERVREIIRKEQYRMIGCSASGPETVIKIDDAPSPNPADEEEAKERQIEALEASVVALKLEVTEWQMKYEGATKLLEEQSKLISVQLANPTTESLLKRIDELQRQQVELYHEIGNLHVLLEQERSRNQGDGSKIKNGGMKKSVRFSAA
ncbi:G kinase-anchoring protein 1-like isoform X1 [Phlebotomus papatasi]|nr:G kinase-anchoring protein 1-like isoform X1 [Phlebotomus papatasi]